MSRCFPFPPPGYERKHRPEDLDVVKEAKRKEKKQKKDKNDKERSKDKEKKGKDGSDEKHREEKDRKGKHKDRKEKHRDKKKDKEDQGKDKEKSSISEETTVAGKLEEKNGENLHPKGHSKDRRGVVDEGKCLALFQGQNGGKPFQNSLPSQGIKESKFVQELGRRIREDETNRGSQLPERVAGLDKRDQETAARVAVRNSSGVLAEEKSYNKDKRVDNRKLDAQGLRNEVGGNAMVQNVTTSLDKRDQETAARAAVRNSSGVLAEEKSYNKDKRVNNRKLDAQGLGNEVGGNAIVQNLTTTEKSKVEEISRPVEEQNDRRREGKEKYKETGDEKRGDKRKDKDKKSHGKDKDKEKEEKAKVKTENKKSEQDNSKGVGSTDLVGVTSNKSTDLLKDGNMKKRKDMVTNGFLHESEIRPVKMHRLAPHQLTENGRKLEVCRPASKSTSDKHVVPNSVPLDKSNRLMNGIIEAQKPSPSKPNPSSATVVSDNIAEASKISLHNSNDLNKTVPVPKIEDKVAKASKRPPHPDSKYLSEVLTVPKLGDLSENDDQEWLFSKKGPSNKPKVKSVVVEEELHVWSEAVHIESADVYALPYVIPY